MKRGRSVLVVGAGGLGTAASWALAEAGNVSLLLIDPDVVEPSNLPRQVLFHDEDVGRPKAEAAAARLRSRFDVPAESIVARLDERRARALIGESDVVVDATDGAPVKSWLNRVAVVCGKPLVHAAALRAEGRTLVVAAGGRPCLECLFGRLEADGGSCADLGIWNAVVGFVGFRAADLALACLAGTAPRRTTYDVYDFDHGRVLQLEAAPSPGCAACGAAGAATRAAGDATIEPLVMDDACRAPDASVANETRGIDLDLLQERCPLNLLRAREALAALPLGARLSIRLGTEGAATVPEGVRALGHAIVASERHGAALHLVVEVRRAVGEAPLERSQLARFARQVVLPDVGPHGQRRLLAAQVDVVGGGLAGEVAACYLARSGVQTTRRPGTRTPVASLVGGSCWSLIGDRMGGTVRAGKQEPADEEQAEAWPAHASVPAQMAYGALLADAVEREIVGVGRSAVAVPWLHAPG